MPNQYHLRLKTEAQVQFASTLPGFVNSTLSAKRRWASYTSNALRNEARDAVTRRYPTAFKEKAAPEMSTAEALKLGWKRPKPRGVRLSPKPWLVLVHCTEHHDDFAQITRQEYRSNTYGLAPIPPTHNRFPAGEIVEWFAMQDPTFPWVDPKWRQDGFLIYHYVSDNVAKHMVFRWKVPV